MNVIASPFDKFYRETQSTQGAGNNGDKKTGSTILVPGQHLLGTGFKAPVLRELVERQFTFNPSVVKSFDRCKDPHPPLPNISLTSQDVTRWKMAWRAIDENWQIYNYSWLEYWEFIVRRCRNWPDMEKISEDFPIALGFSAAALVYGGLHALAWFAHFDSITEQLLWRISACVVMGGVPVILALINLTENYLDHLSHYVFVYLGWIFIGLGLLAYVLARAYLVVECFINLSHLPAEVYDVPTWSTYFPHIS